MWYTLRYSEIESFKARWPCHGLPDDLHSISFEYDAIGDLLDIEAYDDGQRRMDTSKFDGAHLAVLSQDAPKIGDPAD